MVSRYVVFSHGKESGPWGKKISALAVTELSNLFDAPSAMVPALTLTFLCAFSVKSPVSRWKACR